MQFNEHSQRWQMASKIYTDFIFYREAFILKTKEFTAAHLNTFELIDELKQEKEATLWLLDKLS